MLALQSSSQEFWPFFPIFFIGMWLFVSFSISQMGWSSFAVRYPAKNRPAGTAYNSPFTRFSIFTARYSNVVRVIFTEQGIYFYAAFLFRAFHPPFLVPWESVVRVEKKTRWFRPCYNLDIVDPTGEIHVILAGSVANDLLRFRNIQSSNLTAL